MTSRVAAPGTLDRSIGQSTGHRGISETTRTAPFSVGVEGDDVDGRDARELPERLEHIGCRGHECDREVLGVFSRDVLGRIRDRDPAWERMVPPSVASATFRR